MDETDEGILLVIIIGFAFGLIGWFMGFHSTNTEIAKAICRQSYNNLDKYEQCVDRGTAEIIPLTIIREK